MRSELRTLVGIVAICAVCVAPQPAWSDWQYTRWGMTPNEVIVASKGAASETSPSQKSGGKTDNTEALLQGAYSSGKFRFHVTFSFSKGDHKLAFVSLELLDPSLTPDLIGNLRGKYGEPTSTDNGSVLGLIVWREKSDQVSLIQIGNMTELRYQPNLTPDNQGL
jgi:hypothetical protein